MISFICADIIVWGGGERGGGEGRQLILLTG